MDGLAQGLADASAVRDEVRSDDHRKEGGRDCRSAVVRGFPMAVARDYQLAVAAVAGQKVEFAPLQPVASRAVDRDFADRAPDEKLADADPRRSAEGQLGAAAGRVEQMELALGRPVPRLVPASAE